MKCYIIAIVYVTQLTMKIDSVVVLMPNRRTYSYRRQQQVRYPLDPAPLSCERQYFSRHIPNFRLCRRYPSDTDTQPRNTRETPRDDSPNLRTPFGTDHSCYKTSQKAYTSTSTSSPLHIPPPHSCQTQSTQKTASFQTVSPPHCK